MVGFVILKKDKNLPDGSLLIEYSVGNKIFVKLVGGINFNYDFIVKPNS
jgi:hypothetical protein